MHSCLCLLSLLPPWANSRIFWSFSMPHLASMQVLHKCCWVEPTVDHVGFSWLWTGLKALRFSRSRGRTLSVFTKPAFWKTLLICLWLLMWWTNYFYSPSPSRAQAQTPSQNGYCQDVRRLSPQMSLLLYLPGRRGRLPHFFWVRFWGVHHCPGSASPLRFPCGAQAKKPHMKTTHIQYLLKSFASDRQMWSSSALKRILRIPSLDQTWRPAGLAREHAEKCCPHADVIHFSKRQIYNRCNSASFTHSPSSESASEL